jgi:hypothetical protein
MWSSACRIQQKSITAERLWDRSIRQTLDFHKIVLLYHIGHLPLLLFSFVRLLLQFLDLFVQVVEAMPIRASVGERLDEGCIRIFEGLEEGKQETIQLQKWGI